jgi:hypothetical protein
MSESDGFALIDRRRSVDLDDVGGCGLILAVAVASDGAEHLGVVERRALADGDVGFSMATPEHENVGSLAFEIAKRIAIAQRTHRCGRPTGSGELCRITVKRRGDACRWHRSTTGRDSA